jgi:hypothetical protein
MVATQLDLEAFIRSKRQCHEQLVESPSNRITAIIRSKAEESKLNAKWSRDQLIAYDAFLWSEKDRHQEDIDAIDKKRGVLHRAGFQATEPGPWIKEAEIEEAGKHNITTCKGTARYKQTMRRMESEINVNE